MAQIFIVWNIYVDQLIPFFTFDVCILSYVYVA